MHGSAWVTLFRLIPANLHESLVLLVNSGAEVMVQRILRLERDFMLLRGRMSGTTDGGKFIILPYHQIVNVSLNKRMSEEDALKIFEKLGSNLPLPEPSAAPAVAADTVLEADIPTGPVEPMPASSNGVADHVEESAVPSEEAEPAAAEAPGESVQPPTKPTPPSKSILLARLRARLAGEPKK